MKLLNWLLGVLPARGGWKDGADCVAVSYGEAKFYSDRHGWISTIDGVVDAREFEKVTREEYEHAIAMIQRHQQPVWNGEGSPPVGCECECEREVPQGWSRCRINYVSKTLVVYEMLETGSEYASLLSAFKFRPIQTEAERKRNEFAKSLCDHLDDLTEWDSPVGKVHAVAIYDAIAAGKIPHITLK